MSYNLLQPVSAVSAGDMSSNITSAVIEIKNQDNVGIQLHWVGSPTGTFSVQISSNYRQDKNGNVSVVGNWVTLPLSPAITASGSADDAYIDLNQMSAMYLRVLYTASSGAGTLDAFVVAKGV